MRMSRKRRKAYAPVKAAREKQEAERLERLARQRNCPASSESRLNEKKRALGEPAGKRSALKKMPYRLGRKGRRRLRRDAAIRQMAAAASFSTLALLPSAQTTASSLSTLHEVPGSFHAMRDARDGIRNLKAAREAVAQANEALVLAEASLQSARHDRRNAEQGLENARQNLKAAQAYLERVGEQLSQARTECEIRSREAAERQAALEEYEPQIGEQEASVRELVAEREELQAEYDQKFSNPQAGEGDAKAAQAYDALAEAIEKAWDSVGWKQNRIGEVQAMVIEMQRNGLKPPGGSLAMNAAEEQQAYVDRLLEIDAAIDEAEAFLDEMYDYLGELESARDVSEDEAGDAYEMLADLEGEEMDARRSIEETAADLRETEKWEKEAEKNLAEAEAYQKETAAEKERAEHDLEHLGEGSSWTSRLEYYNWHGPYSGHQFVLGQNFYASTENTDYGVETGYVISDSGREHGHYSGLTDTTVSIIQKNDHALYDVHYLLTVGLPTGKTAHQNAQLPEGLAHYTSFGEGWNITPGIEVTRHLNEEDRLTGRLSYAFRGDYDIISDEWEDGGRMTSRHSTVSPGSQLMPELEYMHAGDKGQFLAQLGYTATGSTNQENGSYDDGPGWHLRLYYSHGVTAGDSWQAYASLSHQGKTTFSNHLWDSPLNSPVTWQEYGLGWTHQLDAKQKLHLMFSYQRAIGNVYLYNLHGPNIDADDGYWMDPTRLSLMLSYECRLDDRSSLEWRLERYNIRERGDGGYRGWGTALMFTTSF